MDRVGVVVLNYKAFKDTIVCVDSLLLQRGVEIHVVIVDNASGNESVKVLKDRYDKNLRVEIIESNENLGFARGNNLGIARLRSLGYDFVFLANSDLVFSGDDILYDMVREYSSCRAAAGLIDPVVINPDNSPALFVYFKKKLMRLRMIRTFIEGYFKNRARSNLSPTDILSDEDMIRSYDIDQIRDNLYLGKKEGKPGHLVHEDHFKIIGCAYMYTPDFFKHYDLMYPETFLYGEEYCTALFLAAAGLSTMEVNTAAIVHLGGRSTSPGIKKSKMIRDRYKKAVYGLIATPPGRIVSKYGRVNKA
ncbi:glycosyltransferase [Butyrivibrio sp. MC2013]|uniref:glycosyltransferase n=1 Tax=Butyrivibrio sp. MC2013 TaxID=1280686 RepID=UPI0004061E29|nr:glycosyltransferase family 2 protein [Butyrivibrio sp. MC2013]